MIVTCIGCGGKTRVADLAESFVCEHCQRPARLVDDDGPQEAKPRAPIADPLGDYR